MHSVSAGLNSEDFDLYPGLEEGICELLERELLPDIAAEIGVAAAPGEETYFLFTDALLRLFEVTGLTVREACIGLLRTPLRDRAWRLIEMVHHRRPSEGMAWAFREVEPWLALLKPGPR